MGVWSAVAVVAVAGLAGGVVATVAPEPAALAVPAPHMVLFTATPGAVALAVVARPGSAPEPAQTGVALAVRGPAALALTVRSAGRASCAIVVDGVAVDEETADAGVATCVAAV